MRLRCTITIEKYELALHVKTMIYQDNDISRYHLRYHSTNDEVNCVRYMLGKLIRVSFGVRVRLGLV